MTRREIIEAAVAGHLCGSEYNGWVLRLSPEEFESLRRDLATVEMDGEDHALLAYFCPKGGTVRWVSVWRT